MKKIAIVSSIVLVTLNCMAQKDVVIKEHKNNKNTPIGMVWLKDSIYIDQTEIRNSDYLEFVNWTRIKAPSNLNSILPDTSVWLTCSANSAPFVNYYFQNSAFSNFPVVGISYEQAVAFCKWRTERVKENISNSKSKTQKKIGAKDYYYRLPTKSEWEYAASGGLDNTYIYGYESIINKNNQPKVYVSETKTLFYPENAILVPVNYRDPNRFNLYNTIGNVAEMVLEKGTTKGGSFKHTLTETAISKSIEYIKPTCWIGFRCVYVIEQ